MTEPCDLIAVEARRLIGQKKLAPTELLASCIARIEAVDHAVNAMVARDFDRARAAAKAADAAVARGEDLPPLHGLPLGVKDLEDTEGLRTTQGSPIFRDHVPAADQRSIAAVRAAGAIIVGKTNTPEFGAGRQHAQRRLWRHRQSVRSDEVRRRFLRRIGRRTGNRHGTDRNRL